jgi:hypothetical protein
LLFPFFRIFLFACFPLSWSDLCIFVYFIFLYLYICIFYIFKNAARMNSMHSVRKTFHIT